MSAEAFCGEDESFFGCAFEDPSVLDARRAEMKAQGETDIATRLQPRLDEIKVQIEECTAKSAACGEKISMLYAQLEQERELQCAEDERKKTLEEEQFALENEVLALRGLPLKVKPPPQKVEREHYCESEVSMGSDQNMF